MAIAGCLLIAQQPKPKAPAAPADQDVATFTADANLVVLYMSVVDKNGKLLTNVPQTAFKVYENGVEQPVIDTRAAAATQERMIFFMIIIVVRFVDLQNENTALAGHRLWGVTLPVSFSWCETRP